MTNIETTYAGLKLKNPIIVASSGLTDSAAEGTALSTGRKTKNDKIDFAAGLVLRKKTGDFVREGEVLSAQVVGVLVVAEGADDLKVAMALQQAVQTLLFLAP